jgi:hypothetical protein
VKNHPDFINEIEEKGVIYYRTVPEENDFASVVGRSWKSMFHVKEKADAEKALKDLEYTWTWHDNGDLTMISKVLKAVKECSNGRKAFYN